MKKILTVFLLLGCVSQVAAEEDIVDELYFGVGLGSNELNGPDANGFQFFAGYPLKTKLGIGELALEAGYMDSGDFKRSSTIPSFGSIITTTRATGAWGTLVGNWTVADRTNLLLRAGLDIGEDDGFMYGAGVGYQVSKKLEVRGEYVERDNIDSVQFNLVFR